MPGALDVGARPDLAVKQAVRLPRLHTLRGRLGRRAGPQRVPQPLRRFGVPPVEPPDERDEEDEGADPGDDDQWGPGPARTVRGDSGQSNGGGHGVTFPEGGGGWQ